MSTEKIPNKSGTQLGHKHPTSSDFPRRGQHDDPQKSTSGAREIQHMCPAKWTTHIAHRHNFNLTDGSTDTDVFFISFPLIRVAVGESAQSVIRRCGAPCIRNETADIDYGRTERRLNPLNTGWPQRDARSGQNQGKTA